MRSSSSIITKSSGCAIRRAARLTSPTGEQKSDTHTHANVFSVISVRFFFSFVLFRKKPNENYNKLVTRMISFHSTFLLYRLNFWTYVCNLFSFLGCSRPSPVAVAVRLSSSHIRMNFMSSVTRFSVHSGLVATTTVAVAVAVVIVIIAVVSCGSRTHLFFLALSLTLYHSLPSIFVIFHLFSMGECRFLCSFLFSNFIFISFSLLLFSLARNMFCHEHY